MIVYQYVSTSSSRYEFSNVGFNSYDSPEELTNSNRGTAYGVIKVELE